MKKLLALILSIGMCFACVGCSGKEDTSSENETPQSSQQTTNNGTTEETIDDICDLSNAQTQELAKKLRKASVYPSQNAYEVTAEYLTVQQQYSKLLKDFEYVEEKELALEEAKNSRTVRVFNAETGQWEMQPNQQAIKNAEDDLESAKDLAYTQYQLYGASILNLNVALDGFIYACIAEMLESYTATNISVKEKLDVTLGLYQPLPEGYIGYNQLPEYTGEKPTWYNNIINIIYNESGIQL